MEQRVTIGDVNREPSSYYLRRFKIVTSLGCDITTVYRMTLPDGEFEVNKKQFTMRHIDNSGDKRVLPMSARSLKFYEPINNAGPCFFNFYVNDTDWVEGGLKLNPNTIYLTKILYKNDKKGDIYLHLLYNTFFYNCKPEDNVLCYKIHTVLSGSNPVSMTTEQIQNANTYYAPEDAETVYKLLKNGGFEANIIRDNCIYTERLTL